MGLPVRLCGAVVLWAVACGCGAPDKAVDASVSRSAAPARSFAIPVQVERPARADISARFETNARVVAERRVDVTSEGTGKCVAVFAEEGDRVEPGQVLAELDKQEALAALNQAEVQVRQQKAAYDRAERAWKAGFSPKIEYENARFAYEQSLANCEIQKVQLDNLTIRAPIGGVVTKRNVQVGVLVTAGTPVYSIVDPTSYVLEIHPPERDLPRLRVGQEASVTVDALPDRVLKASVRRINPAVENGTVAALLDFSPEDRTLLKEGAFARVGLVMETHANALLVPKDALIEENGRKYLFVVEPAPRDATQPAPAVERSDPEARDAKPTLVAQRIEVRTGFEDAASIEITDGLADDAQVVTMGQHTLKAGAHVTVTDSAEALEKALTIPPEAALAEARAERAKGNAPAQGDSGHH
jgi:membrane fusion protein (multidrug efflux system)